MLRNSVTTGDTFVEKEAKVQALFDDVAGFSSTSKDFLEQNGSNIIRLSKQGQAQLPLFAKYAPEYPCLLKGMVNWTPHMEQAYRELHPAHQPRGAPELADRLHAGRQPALRRAQRPALREAAQPAVHPERTCTPQPPVSRRRRRRQRRPRQVPPAQRHRPSTSPRATPAPPPSATLVNAFAAPAMGVARE